MDIQSVPVRSPENASAFSGSIARPDGLKPGTVQTALVRGVTGQIMFQPMNIVVAVGDIRI